MNLKTRENSYYQDIQYDSYEFSKSEKIQYFLIGLCIDAVISYVFYQSYIAFLVFLPVIFIYLKYKKNNLIKQRKDTMLIEFKDAILILSSFISAGYSLENSFHQSIAEIDNLYMSKSIILEEFIKIDKKLQMNMSIEKVFDDFAKRTDIDDIKTFSKVIKIAKRSGGNLSYIMSNTINIISEKIRVYEEIITITSAKRFEQKIMNVFPIFLMLYLNLSSKEFFSVMYNTFIGKMVMTLAIILYFIAVYISSKILDIKV